MNDEVNAVQISPNTLIRNTQKVMVSDDARVDSIMIFEERT